MLSGLPYSAEDMRLLRELNATKDVIHRYNALVPSQEEEKKAILKELLGHIADDQICINQPFYCDYGKQISVGKRFFANFNFTVLDEAPVTIGDNCFIGPNVSIYTACHSTDPVERNTRREWAEPVTIGDNVWIGGSDGFCGHGCPGAEETDGVEGFQDGDTKISTRSTELSSMSCWTRSFPTAPVAPITRAFISCNRLW